MTQTDCRAAGVDQRVADLSLYLHELFDGTEGYVHAATLDRRPDGGWHALTGVREGQRGVPSQRRAMLDGLAEALVLESDTGVEVFTCPYPLIGSRVRENGRATIRRHAHADVDGPADLDRVRTLGAWAVASGTTAEDGTPHSHVYVRLTEPVPAHVHTVLCRALGQAVGGEHHDIGKVNDSDVLRPPGTLNYKHEPSLVAWLIRPDDHGVRAWAPEELARELGVPWPVPHHDEDRAAPPAAPRTDDEPQAVRGGLAERRVGPLVALVRNAAPRTGNKTLNYAAGICAALVATTRDQLDATAVREELVQAFLARPLRGRETSQQREREARRTLDSAWRWGTAHPADALSDRRPTITYDDEDHDVTARTTDEPEAGTATEDTAVSWRPIDLRAVADGLRDGSLVRPRPTVGEVGLAPDDGPSALLYRGKVNGLAGESNAGKSWTALVIARQELARGEGVLYLDLEDDQVAMTDRLLLMGADLATARLAYVSPGTRFDAAARGALLTILDELTPSLVVIDSVGEALSLEGMRPNEDDEVARWFRLLPRWLAGHECEPAVLVLDHVPKVEGGLWPIGSQRKRAAITGAQYMQERRAPFSQSRAGYSVLKVAKDRHGAYGTGETAAHLVVTPGHDEVSIDLVSGTPSAQALSTADPMDRAVAALDRIGYPREAAVRNAWEYLTTRIPAGPERPRKSEVEQGQKRRRDSAAGAEK